MQSTSIEKAWRETYTDVWLLLKTRSGSLEEVELAADAATSAAERRNPDDFPYGWAATPVPQGFALQLSSLPELAPLRQWLIDFALELERRRVSGVITRAPRWRHRPWTEASLSRLTTAYFAISFDMAAMLADEYRTSHWHVPAERTTRVMSVTADWARLPESSVVVQQNIYRMEVPVSDPATVVGRAVLATGMGGLEYYDDQAERARHVAFAPGGEGVFQVLDGDHGWRSRVESLRDLMVELAGDLDHAFIRPAHWGIGSVSALDRPVALPGIREHHVRYNKHLLDRYVPDAHGVQVLRGGHIERMADLSTWEVTELDAGRYLVQARDLGPWYAEETPDLAVLEAARADFAGALITEDIIAMEPPPWRYKP